MHPCLEQIDLVVEQHHIEDAPPPTPPRAPSVAVRGAPRLSLPVIHPRQRPVEGRGGRRHAAVHHLDGRRAAVAVSTPIERHVAAAAAASPHPAAVVAAVRHRPRHLADPHFDRGHGVDGRRAPARGALPRRSGTLRRALADRERAALGAAAGAAGASGTGALAAAVGAADGEIFIGDAVRAKGLRWRSRPCRRERGRPTARVGPNQGDATTRWHRRILPMIRRRRESWQTLRWRGRGDRRHAGAANGRRLAAGIVP